MIVAYPGLLAVLLCLEPQQEQALVFAPRERSRVAKQADFSIEFHTLVLEVDGEEFENLDWTPLGLRTKAKFKDTYVELAEGRPSELWREFESLSGTWDEPSQRQDIGGFHALSGCKVGYVWSPQTQAFTCSLKEGKAPDVRVEDLVEDLDLRGFLPGEAVKAGSKWTARGKPVMDALLGATEFGLAGITAEHELEATLHKFFLRPLRELGNQQVEFECRRIDDDGLAPEQVGIDLRQLQKFQLQIADQVNEYLRATTSWDLRVDCFQLDWDVDGKGRLVWNCAEKRFENFDFKAKVGLDMKIEVQVGSAGACQSCMMIRLHLDGVAEWSMSAEQAP